MESFDVIVGCDVIKVEQLDGANVLAEEIHWSKMEHLLTELCQLRRLVYRLICQGTFLLGAELRLCRLTFFRVLNA